VHQQIWGLSTLMKIRGWPRGPPPPSQETARSWVQVTGCLWIKSMAAYGRGWESRQWSARRCMPGCPTHCSFIARILAAGPQFCANWQTGG
jgi:hypothetical protein